MFVLFGLIALTIKIAILSSIYALLTLLVFYFVSKKTEVIWIKAVMQTKFMSWISLGFIYTFILFVYAFSYWGYSGIGDGFCIPAGNGFVVNSIDDQSHSYIEPDQNKKYSRQAFLRNFIIKDEIVCAEFLGFNSDDCNDCFIVLETETGKLYEFHSAQEYSVYATKNGLPQKNVFKSFNENYRNHWSGLKSWLLP